MVRPCARVLMDACNFYHVIFRKALLPQLPIRNHPTLATSCTPIASPSASTSARPPLFVNVLIVRFRPVQNLIVCLTHGLSFHASMFARSMVIINVSQVIALQLALNLQPEASLHGSKNRPMSQLHHGSGIFAVNVLLRFCSFARSCAAQFCYRLLRSGLLQCSVGHGLRCGSGCESGGGVRAQGQELIGCGSIGEYALEKLHRVIATAVVVCSVAGILSMDVAAAYTVQSYMIRLQHLLMPKATARASAQPCLTTSTASFPQDSQPHLCKLCLRQWCW